MSKILFVYYEPQSSGQTAHVLSLARGLDRRRYEVTVVLPVDLDRTITAFEQIGVRVVPLSLRKVLWSPQTIIALARLIREWEPDVVHVHSQEAGPPARVIVRLAGAGAILYTPQTIDIRRTRWHWLYVLFERTLARITDLIISVNESDRRRLIQWGIPPHKVVTVPNGIDLAAFQRPTGVGELRLAFGLDVHRPLVIQVGRLSAQKDPLAFVKGAAQVVRACPDAQFALVGDGPLGGEVAALLCELGLEGHVHLLGWQDQASELMAAADVVTLTSRWEGTPYALLEAMACSRPVVTTAVNGCPEIVVEGLTGFLVPPGDTAAWAGAVTSLLKDPAQASAMGRRGRHRVEERFTLPRMIARIEALYEQVASPQRVAPG
jgi:glycosyltransferase involved in cell wall biosynthesis